MAPKPFAPTPEQRKTVRAMAAYGVPQEDIRMVIGISLPTLHKHFRHELDTAMTEANARVAESLYKTAVSGAGRESVAAAIFWLKARAGWSEKVQLEHSGGITVILNGDDAKL